jgi:hypothetical protein
MTDATQIGIDLTANRLLFTGCVLAGILGLGSKEITATLPVDGDLKIVQGIGFHCFILT